jgi:stress response protein YsnF
VTRQFNTPIQFFNHFSNERRKVMTQTVIGMFDTATEAQQAVHELQNNGFSQSNIDISNQSAASTDNSTFDTYRDNNDDSIGGFFKSLFSDNDTDADRYSEVARRSGSIVTVHAQTSEEAERAADILDKYGAVDVNERASQYGYSNFGRTDTSIREADTTGKTIPIIEENLNVGKREVETGRTRLRSWIVERPVEEKLRLREERVYVNRTPADRPATEADFANFREGETEITQHAEVPVVNKEARVVEEISLGKEVEEHEETIRGSVRSTNVDVDRLDEDKDDSDSRLTS